MTKKRISELEVLISANTTQYTKSLELVSRQLAGLNDKLEGTGKQSSASFGTFFGANIASRVLMNTVSSLGRGFMNLTKSVVELGSSYSRMSIATSTMANNMNISTEQLKGWREELAQANTYGSIADDVLRNLLLSDMHELAGEMKSVDARTGEWKTGLSALVLTMKDLAAAAGQDSGPAIKKITKFIQSGNASFVDGIIEVGNMNNAYREFGDRIGKTVQQLTTQERAEARLNLVKEQGIKVWGAYANTMQTSGKAFASIRDVWRNLRETLGKQLEPVLRVGSNAVLQFANGLREHLILSEASVISWANRVAGVLIGFVRVLGTLFSKLPIIGKGFERLKDFTLKPIQAQGSLEEQLDATGSSMGDVANETEALKKSLNGLASFDELNVLGKQEAGTGAGGVTGGGLDFGGDELDLTADGIEQINEQATKVQETIMGWLEPIRRFAEWISTATLFGHPLIKVIGEVGKALLIFGGIFLFISKVVGLVVGVLALFGGGLAALFSPITLIALAVAGVVTALWLLYNNVPVVKNAVDNFIENMKKGFEAWGQVISWTWNNVVKPVFNFLASTVKWLWTDVFKPNFERIGAVITWVWNSIIKPVFNFFVGLLTGLIIPNLLNFFAIVKWVFEGAGSIIGAMWGFVLRATQPFVDFFWGTLIPTLQGIRSKIFDVFSQSGIGGFISGFWNTIVGGVKKGINAVIGHINGIIDRINTMIWNINYVGKNIPGWQNITFRVPKIPELATGGVVTGDTLARLGEGGNREAVIPLDRNTEWADIIASKLNSNGGEQRITIKIGDEVLYDKVVERINEKSLLSNGLVLNI